MAKKETKNNEENGYNLVAKYFINEKSVSNIEKPIMWIHIPYDINARKWESFYSRNTLNFNQDYLYLTLRSIINKCGDNFHICLINDNSFEKLLPNWPKNLAFSSNPIKTNMKNLGLASLLYKYGGLVVPVSFICNKCFNDIYNQIDENTIIVGEFLNKSNLSYKYYPNSKILGCKKNNPFMLKYIKYLENLYANNFTDSVSFEDLTNKWFSNNINNLLIIKSKYLGIEDDEGNIINIDQLLNNKFIKINKNSYGIYIPSEELLNRTAYNWFVYLNINEVLNSNTQIGQFLLISQ